MLSSSTAVALVLLLVGALQWDKARRKKTELPSRGFGDIWVSYLTSVVNLLHTKAGIQATADRYPNDPFTFPLLGEWFVMAKSKQLVKDQCNAPEEILSMEAAADELLQLHYTIGAQFCSETYHIPAIRTSLNLNKTRQGYALASHVFRWLLLVHSAFSKTVKQPRNIRNM
ncbi:Cytochrome P450 [Mycena kentingensis (nom. inval.)]|nr:Cytochrome P450 [Mycena kentingensis (nom. inval.)]